MADGCFDGSDAAEAVESDEADSGGSTGNGGDGDCEKEDQRKQAVEVRQSVIMGIVISTSFSCNTSA